uniref:tRNA (guanine(37)-N1)-methyltransferase n=1 Tax=Blastobotrys adeninivorans TaxID=409370 RepID=A0A060TD02_BLAAD
MIYGRRPGVGLTRFIGFRGIRVSTIFKSRFSASTYTMSKPELTRDFPPPVNRTMKELDREFFKRDVPLVAAWLKDPSYITTLGKVARNDLLQLQGVSRVVKSDDDRRGVLLRHEITNPSVALDEVSEESRQVFDKAGASFEPYTLTLTYDYWKTDEILAAILPEELLDEVPSGFTNVGHIAHMNIREEYMPYRFLIGQVVLDKNPLVETVVNKLDTIDTVYRTFAMEVLAGKEKFDVEQSESGCKFRFRFDRVYWNTRLHTEHGRLIKQFGKGEAVCDVFAGVGPFAVPAGRKGVVVFANDLNPDSHESLVGNIKLNKVQATVFPYNEDGRAFIEQSARRILEFQDEHDHVDLYPRRTSRSKPVLPERIEVPKRFQHYVMNLPDSALTFLDAFVGLYGDEEVRKRAQINDEKDLPMIHVHCFYKADPMEPEPPQEVVYNDLLNTVNGKLGSEMTVDKLSFHKVRKVAPTKTMYCISFRLPASAAFAAKQN